MQVQLATRIELELALALDRIAKETDMAKAKIVDMALRNWIEQYNQNPKNGELFNPKPSRDEKGRFSKKQK